MDILLAEEDSSDEEYRPDEEEEDETAEDVRLLEHSGRMWLEVIVNRSVCVCACVRRPSRRATWRAWLRPPGGAVGAGRRRTAAAPGRSDDPQVGPVLALDGFLTSSRPGPDVSEQLPAWEAGLSFHGTAPSAQSPAPESRD